MSSPTVSISEHFTWTSAVFALCGGLVIGLTATANLLARGRITGISGILQALSSLRLQHAKRVWRLGFLCGMAMASGLIAELYPTAFAADAHDPTWLTALVAGALVGVGTKLGSGCTSGHGVCGLPRLSRRSLASVCTFCTIGAAVATLLGLTGARAALSQPAAPRALLRWPVLGASAAGVLVLVATTLLTRPRARGGGARAVLESDSVDVLLNAGLGALFALGLAISGMVRPSRVLGFLDPVAVGWDPTLAFVLAAAVAFNLGAFRLVLRRERPVLACAFELPTATAITRELVGGAVLFGAGWGVSGLCPGPALCALGAGKPCALVFCAATVLAQMATEQAQARVPSARVTPQTAPLTDVEAAGGGKPRPIALWREKSSALGTRSG